MLLCKSRCPDRDAIGSSIEKMGTSNCTMLQHSQTPSVTTDVEPKARLLGVFRLGVYKTLSMEG